MCLFACSKVSPCALDKGIDVSCGPDSAVNRIMAVWRELKRSDGGQYQINIKTQWAQGKQKFTVHHKNIRSFNQEVISMISSCWNLCSSNCSPSWRCWLCVQNNLLNQFGLLPVTFCPIIVKQKRKKNVMSWRCTSDENIHSLAAAAEFHSCFLI